MCHAGDAWVRTMLVQYLPVCVLKNLECLGFKIENMNKLYFKHVEKNVSKYKGFFLYIAFKKFSSIYGKFL